MCTEARRRGIALKLFGREIAGSRDEMRDTVDVIQDKLAPDVLAEQAKKAMSEVTERAVQEAMKALDREALKKLDRPQPIDRTSKRP